MSERAQDIRDGIDKKRQELFAMEEHLRRRRADLDQAEKNCRHEWDVVRDDLREGGYTIPGDPPGTMGIDWRGPCHVPAKTTPRWRRTCRVCGKVEYTTRIETEEIKHPKF